MKVGLPLIKKKLMPLGLTTTTAADAGILKKIYASGGSYGLWQTTPIISNKEIEDSKKIAKSRKTSG